ncbi:AAA-like domain-containing protein [Scytonema sp. PRP1]|uniref:AAA-like domain-containing protein n=1 Tax=Scytonema sp. PRP1 TaxID=3120513 RepID=UPI002FD70D80
MIKIEANSAYCYQAGGGSLAFGHPTYVQRQADTDLYDALDNGEYCYVLNARQMGKSSLRVQAKHRLQNENIACISIDLQGIEKNITQERWYYSIAYELIKHLGKITDFDLKSWWNKHDALSYIQRLIKLIESQLLINISKRIVIFIDEIDKIISLDFIKDDFLSFIRFCYNQRTEKQIISVLRLCC